jgi:hypothetical protein
MVVVGVKWEELEIELMLRGYRDKNGSLIPDDDHSSSGLAQTALNDVRRIIVFAAGSTETRLSQRRVPSWAIARFQVD